MPEALLPQLAQWSNFYVIVGSSAGALTGLQFVVLTLVAQSRAVGTSREIRAFATPTIVHFFSALLVSAIISAPWKSLEDFGACLTVAGVIGVVYIIGVIWHARGTTVYKPDVEDWIWYIVLPLLTYAGLTVAAALVATRTSGGLFAIAGVTIFLLVIGIHNAWDTITYIALQHTRKPGNAAGGSEPLKPVS